MGVGGRKETNALPVDVVTETKHSSVLSNNSLIFLILTVAYVAAFCNRLFAVIRFESIIHEFDPWFNYRATAYMVEHGFYNFLNWFDERAWYPLGRIVGGTVYPGLMLTSGLIHHLLDQVSIRVHIRDICVFLAPVFSGLTAIATYFLSKELWSPGAGLFAAAFISIVPGYISRSVAGSYDNEGIAIFALQATYFLWIKALKSGSIFWAAFTALSYFYMVSAWGGYVFIINLIPLHVFVLIAMGRYSHRIYVSYSTFYVLGLLLSMQIPFVGFQPIRTSEHMAATGVFLLVQAVSLFQFLQSRMSRSEIRMIGIVVTIAVSSIVYLIVWSLTLKGVIAPWSGRFYSLWDTSYAKIHIPIISSVSEHQPTTWFSFFFDLHVLICTFPVGLWYIIKNLNDERVFAVLYALSAVYFAGIMVRLMLTLTPIVCVLSGIAFSIFFEQYTKAVKPTQKQQLRQNIDELTTTMKQQPIINCDDMSGQSQQQYDRVGVIKNRKQRATSSGTPNNASFNLNANSSGNSSSPGILFNSAAYSLVIYLLAMFAIHCTWVTSNAYSNPSVVLASYSNDGSRVILDDFREAYYWLSQNTENDARVMSWWDYGYQIAGMANRTTLVDNNTWNNSHIALVGKAMSSNESVAYDIMTKLDVDYVLVIFGGLIGYSGDDINKFLWMVRIANGEYPSEIKESSYFTTNGEYRVDEMASKTMLDCLMYKLSYYRFGKLQLNSRMPAGYDRTRNAVIGNKNFELTYLEEAFTSEHWLVRIYRVKKPHEFNRLVVDDEWTANTAKSLVRGVSAVSAKANGSGISSNSWALAARKRYRKSVSQKTERSRKGVIKSKAVIIKNARKASSGSSSSTNKSGSAKIVQKLSH